MKKIILLLLLTPSLSYADSIDNYIASSTIQNSYTDLTGLSMGSVVQWVVGLFQTLIGQSLVLMSGYVGWMVAILAIFMVLNVSIGGFYFFKH